MTDHSPMLIGGAVFTEWYWSPIFALLVYGPPIGALAAVIYALTRRTRLPRARRVAAAVVSAGALVVGGAQIVAHVRFERAEARQAATIHFATFAPRGFNAERAEVYAGEPSVQWSYGGGLFASQHAARDDDVTPPACRIHTGTTSASYQGPCTGAGSGAAFAATPHPTAMTVRDGTLIVATGAGVTRERLLAYMRALEPVAPADIDYER